MSAYKVVRYEPGGLSRRREVEHAIIQGEVVVAVLFGRTDEEAKAVSFMLSRPSDIVRAWAHADDPDRVISAKHKAEAIREGGASASAVAPYTVALAVVEGW